MSNPKDLERIGNLFNASSDQSKSFFDRCSKTKFLAVKDYYRAESEYVKLAKKTLSVKTLGITGKSDCFGCLSSVKTALESGQLNQEYIDALENLRTTYLDRMLRPAFRQYIHNDAVNKQALEKVYTNAMKIESLIEVVQFMNKVQDIE
ncbi:hypothetical protein EU528_09150 [Candidatus Thorarchaeota archaeon]|nr:MAG: hypothetical protein EU528_09150 [Candidatus Thorarchaeota archaeon]